MKISDRLRSWIVIEKKSRRRPDLQSLLNEAAILIDAQGAELERLRHIQSQIEIHPVDYSGATWAPREILQQISRRCRKQAVWQLDSDLEEVLGQLEKVINTVSPAPVHTARHLVITGASEIALFDQLWTTIFKTRLKHWVNRRRDYISKESFDRAKEKVFNMQDIFDKASRLLEARLSYLEHGEIKPNGNRIYSDDSCTDIIQ